VSEAADGDSPRPIDGLAIGLPLGFSWSIQDSIRQRIIDTAIIMCGSFVLVYLLFGVCYISSVYTCMLYYLLLSSLLFILFIYLFICLSCIELYI